MKFAFYLFGSSSHYSEIVARAIIPMIKSTTTTDAVILALAWISVIVIEDKYYYFFFAKFLLM